MRAIMNTVSRNLCFFFGTDKVDHCKPQLCHRAHSSTYMLSLKKGYLPLSSTRRVDVCPSRWKISRIFHRMRASFIHSLGSISRLHEARCGRSWINIICRDGTSRVSSSSEEMIKRFIHWENQIFTTPLRSFTYRIVSFLSDFLMIVSQTHALFSTLCQSCVSHCALDCETIQTK